ncbi:dihydrofolate reductase [Malassezia japonica]|uniref:Dihydrofolate reductase n=1 Tax=Malassezia japonica TaxID=223818 RepID=A0AAF0EYP6_9BASI|nr:dihydrofolate reductase [Malassezia japonica]WFD39430.1 dihydrofolate reductase [Malassezia japonica]
MIDAAQKLRVLVVHGFASNGHAFKKRTSALQKACRDVADLIFLDAPIQVQALPSEANPEPGPPNPDDPIEKQALAWWRHNNDQYEGWADTAKFLERKFQELGPFDGVLGFSQGGCLAGVLAAALEHPELVPDFHGTFQRERFRFMISVSGFRARPDAFQALMDAKIATPALIIRGKEDMIVPPQLTETLVEVCSNVRVAEHGGGHYLPTPAPWRNFVRDYIEAFRSGQPDAWRTIPAPPCEEENSDSKL